jgi:hypothetical protein
MPPVGGTDSWCIGLTTVPPSCADYLEIWEPQPPGTQGVCPGLYRDRFTFSYIFVLMPISTLMMTQITGFETVV